VLLPLLTGSISDVLLCRMYNVFGVSPHHIITLVNSIPNTTLATITNRPSASANANDIFIGIDFATSPLPRLDRSHDHASGCSALQRGKQCLRPPQHLQDLLLNRGIRLIQFLLSTNSCRSSRRAIKVFEGRTRREAGLNFGHRHGLARPFPRNAQPQSFHGVFDGSASPYPTKPLHSPDLKTVALNAHRVAPGSENSPTHSTSIPQHFLL
jgi:hypothetical protein